MKDKVSVIIPFFNSEIYIQETLESIFNQTYENIEVILVNDGSSNNSVYLLDKLNIKFPSLIILHKINEGAAIARNTGAAVATGEYLLFIDSDDKIAPTYIEKCLAVLDSNKSVRLVYSKGENFGTKQGEWVLPEYSLNRMLFENCIHISALIYKADFEYCNGFNKELSFFEDWDLWLSIIKNGGAVFIIKEKLFYYRRREEKNSLSDQIAGKNNLISENIFKVYCKHYEFYKSNGILFVDLFRACLLNNQLKRKYYNIWYKKIFYNFKNIISKNKKKELSHFEKIMESIK